MNALIVTLFLFIAWTGVRDYVRVVSRGGEENSGLMEMQVTAFLIPVLFHRKEQLRQLIWVIALSVAYYGTKGGVWSLDDWGGEPCMGSREHLH